MREATGAARGVFAGERQESSPMFATMLARPALVLAAALGAALAAAHPAQAQLSPQDRNRGATMPAPPTAPPPSVSPINPSRSPPVGSAPTSGLDQQKLLDYRNQLQSRQLQDRMSGRDMTPGGSQDRRTLDNELGRVNGA